mmetsp:Transcript_8811/g.16455  ORF Transcript_8811/g.16455 Transcript_8811/m.16455 type:complete len:311 (+) Transcript_8811:49-981(+)
MFQSKTGRMYFRCKTQQDLQQWLAATRAIAGVGFLAALPVLKRCHTTSWSRIYDFVIRKDSRGRTILHLLGNKSNAGSSLPSWIAAMGSTQGPLALLAFLESKDESGVAAHEVLPSLEKLKKQITTDMDVPTNGRKSITPQTLLSVAKSGGTFLSFYIGNVKVKDGVSSNMMLRISVINLAQDGIKSENVVETPCVIDPLEETCYGKMWHMQTPLEQLPSGATIVLQFISRDNCRDVAQPLLQPFNTKTAGIDKLSSGRQTFAFVASPQLPRTRFNVLTGFRKHTPNTVQVLKLDVDIHYSMRLQPCVNF